MDDDFRDGGRTGGSGVYGGFDTSYEWDEEAERSPESEELRKRRKKRRKRIEKRRKRKKKRKKKLVIAGITAAIICVLLYAFLSSSLFSISEITVDKNTMKTDQELISESGVKIGDNIFSHTGHSIKKAIMAKNKYITDVKISRRLPNELTITVTEHNPTAAIKYKGKYLILDEEGKVTGTEDTQLTATRITGLKVTSYSEGHTPVVDDSSRLKQAIRLINKVNASGMYFKKLDMSSTLLVHGYITDTLECSGEISDIEDNLEGIKAVIYDLGQKGTMNGVINVGNDGYATFTPAA